VDRGDNASRHEHELMPISLRLANRPTGGGLRYADSYDSDALIPACGPNTARNESPSATQSPTGQFEI